MKSKHRLGIIVAIVFLFIVVAIIAYLDNVKVINSDYNASKNTTLVATFFEWFKLEYSSQSKLEPHIASNPTTSPPVEEPVSESIPVIEYVYITLEPTNAPTISLTPEATMIPHVTEHTLFTATASSVYQLIYNGNDYSVGADMAVDGSLNTAWNEGASGLGIGEWICLKPSDNVSRLYNGFSIANGFQYHNYHKEDRWGKNGRVSSLKVYGDDIYIGTFAISDNCDGYEDIYFPEPAYCLSLKFVIDSAIEGTDFSDTCISEIRPF